MVKSTKAKSTKRSVDRVTSSQQLAALIREAHRKTDEIQTLSGELGGRIKTAVENGHLHRKAFRLMLSLFKMEELKREDFIRSIGLYIEMCREEKLFGAEHAGDLIERGESTEPADGEPPVDGEPTEPVDGEPADGAAVDVVALGDAARTALASGIKEYKGKGKARKGAGLGGSTGTYRAVQPRTN